MPKKNNNNLIIIIVVVVLALVLLGGFGGYGLMGGYNSGFMFGWILNIIIIILIILGIFWLFKNMDYIKRRLKI